MMNKKISTLLLTGMMVMSMGTSVFAADGLNQAGTKDDPATVSVTKKLEFAEGISTPDSSFDFTASKITTVTPDAPDATIKSIKYTNGDETGKLENRKYVISKTSKIEFGNFPHAGEYQYKVTETKGKMEGMTYATNAYTLKVYVANADNNKLYIKTITATEDGKQQKPDKVLFTNTYRKKGGEVGNKDSLVIRKDIEGELADKTKKFEFELIFDRAVTTPDTETELTGKIGNETINFTYEQGKRFKLTDGQELKFENIPAGTRYKVTEIGAKDGYVPSVDVVENGTEIKTRTANEEDSLSSADNDKTNLIGEKENKVTFTNRYDAKPVTGIIAKNAPMILVAALGVLAMLGYALTKRRFVKR